MSRPGCGGGGEGEGGLGGDVVVEVESGWRLAASS